MLKEFKKFIAQGNVIDMAVGIIIGASFGTIVKSLVDDVIMPPIGLLLGNIDFSNLFVLLKEGAKAAAPYASLADAKTAGAVTLNYGLFINHIVSFLIVTFSVFMLVKSVNKLKKVEATSESITTTKECPKCFSTISVKASKCAFCTSEV